MAGAVRGEKAQAEARRGQPLEEWAAKRGGKPVDEVLCADTACPATARPHIHPKRSPRLVAYIDADSGGWERPA